MTRHRTRLLAAALALLLLAVPGRADTLLQVVIDHSGVLHDEQDPQGKTGFNRFLGSFLHELARAHRRERGDTRIVLISAVEPPHILWSGSAADFYREGLRSAPVEAVVSGQPNGCNNLPVALAEAAANLRLEPAKTSALYLVTSGVHSGPGCTALTQEGYVKLVETADPAVAEAITGLASQVGKLDVFFLTATQRRALAAAIDWKALGITLLAQGQNPEF
jgi:hypothetical protein